MSYCRFSSDNWRSHVYVYEDVSGGWTTHVAARKRIIPPIPDIPMKIWPDLRGVFQKETRAMKYPNRFYAILAQVVFGFAGFWHYKVHAKSLNIIPLRNIGLPFDGQTLNCDSPRECADLLESLRATGYQVPQYAIDRLREEQNEEFIK